jgi:glycosyltransferase involved in cell wall biosynthesis
MYKYKFTVFTPCYNSAHTIARVIESLRMQTFKDFEWIVVDDCSNDNLYEVIEPLIKKNEFPVKYFFQEKNFGKPSAINLGVCNAQGEFFLTIDADDAFSNDALEILNNTYEEIPLNLRDTISAVTANCQDQYGNFIGTPYPAGSDGKLICDVFDMRYKYKVEGEKWGFTKTDIMKEFPFNTNIDTFVTENTVWFAIADKYKAVFINKTLRTYFRNENPSSLGSIGERKHPSGFVFYYQEIINKYMKKMYLSFTDIIRLYKNLIKFALYAGIKITVAVKELNKLHKKMFAWLCMPLGYLAVYIDKRKAKGTALP